MDFKVFTFLGLSLILAPTLITTDLRAAQAQECRPNCFSNYSSRTRVNGRRELIAQLEQLIKSGQAKAIDYNKLGELYQQEGESNLARERYSTALELAKQEADLKSQAVAHSGLSQLSNIPIQRNSSQLRNEGLVDKSSPGTIENRQLETPANLNQR